jgi:hypothetical protein
VEPSPDSGLMPVAEPSPAGHPAATAHLLGKILPPSPSREPGGRRPVALTFTACADQPSIPVNSALQAEKLAHPGVFC